MKIKWTYLAHALFIISLPRNFYLQQVHQTLSTPSRWTFIHYNTESIDNHEIEKISIQDICMYIVTNISELLKLIIVYLALSHIYVENGNN